MGKDEKEKLRSSLVSDLFFKEKRQLYIDIKVVSDLHIILRSRNDLNINKFDYKTPDRTGNP